MKRDYLVFCSTNHGKATPELYGEGRLFDVCCHDYAHWADKETGSFRQSEYWFPCPHQEKFETAAKVLPALPSYKFTAIIDDDISVTTDELNRLFQIGDALKLDLYQPALTPNSYGSWPHLFQQANSFVRPVSMVEVMMPFMSKEFLEEHVGFFDLNISSWGLDLYEWGAGYVIDKIAVGHHRKPGRRDRTLRNGLTPGQECEIVRKILGPL